MNFNEPLATEDKMGIAQMPISELEVLCLMVPEGTLRGDFVRGVLDVKCRLRDAALEATG